MGLITFSSIYLPYCLVRQEDGSWVVLNREYKPVGFYTRTWVDYADYPVSVRLRGLGPKTLERLAFNGKYEDGRVYLYNDGCVPTHSPEKLKSYLERVAILAKLRTSGSTPLHGHVTW